MPAPEDNPDNGTTEGPLLALVARALERWLRQQCQEVSHLEIQLEGSMGQLLRGHLQGVRLRARQVVFQSFRLDEVELSSDPIDFKVGGLLRGQSLRLDHPFRVRGVVRLTEDGLSQSLATPEWRGLRDHLGEGLMGPSPLEGVRLLEERLILRAPAHHGELQVETRMVLTPEGLEVRPLDGRPPLSLPMDPAIRLDRAEVRSSRMELAGEALVQP